MFSATFYQKENKHHYINVNYVNHATLKLNYCIFHMNQRNSDIGTPSISSKVWFSPAMPQINV